MSRYLRSLVWLTCVLLLTNACTTATRQRESAQAATAGAFVPKATAPAEAGFALQQAAGAHSPTSDAIPIDAEDAVWGAPDAPVTLVEFTDLQCPFCARANATLIALRQKYGPERLRVVLKHNPLEFHPHARHAAEVADSVLRAAGPRPFFAFIDLAFENQEKLGDPALSEWVTRVGLDAASVVERSRLPATAQKLDRDIELAARLGANGTPAFRINGVTINGAQDLDAFVAVIDRELLATAELARTGTAKEAIYGTRVATNLVKPEPEEEEAEPQDFSVWKVPIAGAPSQGPRDALVTLVEFSDFECPFCRHVQATLKTLLAQYPKELRLVARQAPLPFHPRAVPAANLALEARAEKGDAGFFAASDKLYASESLDDAALLGIAKDLGLDARRVRRAIEKNTHAIEIDTDTDIASDFDVQGTPHFFVNGIRLVGAQPLSEFTTAIEAALKIARALVARGTPAARVYQELMSDAKESAPPQQKALPAPNADSPSRGPANAPVVVQEFADFQCPFCARSEPTLRELERAFPGKIRVVWRHLPLPFHDHAKLAARAALEARAQRGDGAFWQMHAWLMRDQGSAAAFSQATLDGYADTLKLDRSRFDAALNDDRHDAVIARDVALAESVDIHGTPSFVINGYFVSGAQPLSVFRRAVRYALARPKAKPEPEPS